MQQRCPRCNAPINYGIRFCSQCGQPLVWQQQPPPPPQYQQQFEGPPIQEAIRYAQTRGAQLTAKYGLTPSSANRLAQIVSDGIKNKRGIPGLARDIRKEFPDISKIQSELIARTETAYSLEAAFIERSKAMGIEYKEWVCVPDSCDICRTNAAVGVIPMNQRFPGGVMHPPQHDGCRCALAPARLR